MLYIWFERMMATGLVGVIIVGVVALVAWTALIYACSLDDEEDS